MKRKLALSNSAETMESRNHLIQKINKLEQAVKNTCEMAARSILQALDMKDHYTYGHSTRVAYFALVLGKEIGLTEDELYKLELTSLFHDIGKIGIPDSVLLKKERLESSEYNLMKEHPVKSYEILNGFTQFQDIAFYAKHHHERYDGRGYPDGLAGESIPLFSRIVLICDTFDAITSSRPYRKGLNFETAYKELLDFSNTQFDPKLVSSFIKAHKAEQEKMEKTFTLTIIRKDFLKEAA